MGINDVGYGGYGAFVSNYRINDIPKADQVEKITPVKPVEEVDKKREYLIEEVNKAPRSTDPNRVSITFNKGDDYSYIGSEKDITGLDMQKAVSDMKQDSILQEYNYFVGSASNVFSSEDGVVLAK